MQRVVTQDAASAAQKVIENRAQEFVRPARRPSADVKGLAFPRFFALSGKDPFDEVTWETRTALISNDRGEVVFEQAGVEVPSFWSQQATNIVVSKYFRGQVGTPERETSVRQLIGRVVDTIVSWARGGRYFASEERREGLRRRPEAPDGLPEGVVQQPRVVQLRHREAAAVLRVLHQLGAGHARLDPVAGQDRGDAVQVRLGHRHQPLVAAVLAGVAGRRRHRLGSGLVHEGLRRVRRRDQVGREDPARGEDGDPQRRSPRRRRLHQVQGRGGEEGLGADRRGLRRLVRRARVLVGLLPELQQQRARDGRLHARGARRRPVADSGGDRRARDGDAQGPRADADDRRRHSPVRRPRHAVRHDDQRVAHVPRLGADQRVQPVLGVHVPRRLGVQPGVDQPDEVRRGERRVRRRVASARPSTR